MNKQQAKKWNRQVRDQTLRAIHLVSNASLFSEAELRKQEESALESDYSEKERFG